jgi:hypothetical protein
VIQYDDQGSARGRGIRTWEVRGVHRGPMQSDNASGPSEVGGPKDVRQGRSSRGPLSAEADVSDGRGCLQRGDPPSLRRGMGSFPFFGVSDTLPRKGIRPLGGLTKGSIRGCSLLRPFFTGQRRDLSQKGPFLPGPPRVSTSPPKRSGSPLE